MQPDNYCKLVKNYLHFVPLWSGVIRNSRRESNAVFERQFATVKHDVQLKERNNPWKTRRLVYVSAKGLAKYAVVSSRKKMR